MTSHDLLLKWSQDRDELAFREIVHRHAAMVFATAKRILRNDAEAEDVTQECFETLAKTQRLPGDHLPAWLHRVATNRCLDRLRAAGRRTKRETDFASRQFQANATDWNDIYDLVDEAIAELPDKWRSVVVAHFLEGRSQSDIANELNLTRQAVHERLNRGIECIRGHLKRRGLQIPATTLAALFAQHMTASALSATLTASLGKLAIATYTAAGATVVAGLGGFSFAKMLGALALTVAVAYTVIQVANNRGGTPGEPPVALSPLAAAQNADPVPATTESPADTIKPTPPLTLPDGPSTPAPSAQETVNREAPDLASLSGIVVRRDGGAYANAQIRFEPLPFVDFNKTKQPIPIISCDADGQGRFHMAGLKAGEYSIQVMPPGAITSGEKYEVTRVELKENEQRADLKLIYGGEGNLTISGRVTNGSGDPIANATVTSSGGPRGAAAVSDHNGNFTIEYLTEGQYHLMVMYQADENQRIAVTQSSAWAGDKDVSIVFATKGAVTGRVVDAQTGLPITAYRAAARRGNYVSYNPELMQHAVPFTNSKGAFHLKDVEPGDTLITVAAQGYAADYLVTHVKDGETVSDLLIRLERSKIVHGQVVDESGNAVPNAEIRLGEILSAQSRERLDVTCHTDANGAFKIDSLPKQLVAINAFHAGFAPGAAAPTDGMTIVLKRPPRLTISVTREGQPLAESIWRVRYGWESLVRGEFIGRTDENGRATIDDIVPGLIQITARSGERELQKHLHLEPGSEDHLAFDFTPAAATLEGIITSNGAPIGSGHVFVWIDAEDGTEEIRTNTRHDGAYWFDNLPAGKAKMRVLIEQNDKNIPFRPDLFRELTLQPSTANRLDINVIANSRVEGSFRDIDASHRYLVTLCAGDHKLEDLAADLESGLGKFHGIVAVRDLDNGTDFVIENVEPGRYTVLLSSALRADVSTHRYFAAAPIEVAPGQTAVVHFDK